MVSHILENNPFIIWTPLQYAFVLKSALATVANDVQPNFEVLI